MGGQTDEEMWFRFFFLLVKNAQSGRPGKCHGHTEKKGVNINRFSTTFYHTTIYRQQQIFLFRHRVLLYDNQSATAYLPVSAPRFTTQQSIGNSGFAGFGTTFYHTTMNRQKRICLFRHHILPHNNQSATADLPVSAPHFTIQQSIGNSGFAGFGTTFYHTTINRQERICRFRLHVLPYNSL